MAKEIDYSANGSYEAAVERSKKIEADIQVNPKKYRVLTGDRPTGLLHIGHYFGSLQNRVRLANLGVPTMILIADYQVLTDHDAFDKISQNTKQLVIDYLAAGINPEKQDVIIYPHSYVPEANQLMLPFLTLVSNAELSRNPTVKEEIQSAGLTNVNAGMYTYPVHQAVDILFCKGNVVPVGKDQLPHLELTRTIARRFNEKFSPKNPIFPEPQALLSKTPSILGLDGSQKMSKSRGNAIMLSATEDETAKLIKKAKTDGERNITYDPVNRPEVANLLMLISLCTGEEPSAIAEKIGMGGGGMLKSTLTEALNETLRPLRAERARLEKAPEYIRSVLLNGAKKAREIAIQTLDEVRAAMNMVI
ncbi:MAG: tryptophan--tRNA ligase [Treponema sp.]|nr:tryptophan--tRNA ligase [Treponema sp.]